MTVSLQIFINGGVSQAVVPDPDRIPVKAIREAVDKFAKRAAKVREAQAALQIADNARRDADNNARVAAAQAAESGGDVPTKKLARAVRAAEEALEEARLEVGAREAAAAKAQAELTATIEKHTPAWRDAAIREADAAVLRLTTARRNAEVAGRELAEHLGVLGLLSNLPTTLVPVLTSGGMAEVHVSLALDNLRGAIGAAMEALDVERGAAASKPDVVVIVPGEDQVDEITPTVPAELGDLAIGDDDGE
jgi:hypothetical protein